MAKVEETHATSQFRELSATSPDGPQSGERAVCAFLESRWAAATWPSSDGLTVWIKFESGERL
jgi:hypothetical protein